MKIGLFDSGVGGISVLKKLIDEFPKFDYVYLADTKRAPFGTKNHQRLREIVEEDINILKDYGAELIVAACNTADSIALDMDVSIPYISIIESGIEMVRGKKIGIVATEATVKLRSYAKRLKGKEVIQKALQELVSVVENDAENVELIRSILKESIDEEISSCDEVILGCTHFSLISDIFRAVLKSKVLNPVDRIVEKLGVYEESGSGSIEILVTSNVDLFKEKVEKLGILRGVNPNYRQVDIDEESHSDIGTVGIG